MAPSKNSPLCRECWHSRSKHYLVSKPTATKTGMHGICQIGSCGCEGYLGEPAAKRDRKLETQRRAYRTLRGLR